MSEVSRARGVGRGGLAGGTMQKLIIGCGYLGERVAREWLRQGHDVWGLTRSATHADGFSASGIQPVRGDILVPKSLEKLPAAETVLCAVGFDRMSPASKRDVYVDGLRNVLRVMRAKCQRFLYVSSISVYGQDNGEWVDELSPANSNAEHGRICCDAESVLWKTLGPELQKCSEPEVGAVILRLAGIYGPGRLLARVEQLRRGDRIGGNPEAWLNLIHVEDAVQAVLAAEARGRSGETYLVCDDLPLLRREYYTALAERVEAPAPQFEEFAEDSPDRNRLNKRCLNRRLRQELGVELRYPTVIDGLRSLPEATR